MSNDPARIFRETLASYDDCLCSLPVDQSVPYHPHVVRPPEGIVHPESSLELHASHSTIRLDGLRSLVSGSLAPRYAGTTKRPAWRMVVQQLQIEQRPNQGDAAKSLRGQGSCFTPPAAFPSHRQEPRLLRSSVIFFR